MPDEDPIAHRYRLLAPHLTDEELRLWAAAEASVLGPEATVTLARITGIPEAEIRSSLRQIQTRAKPHPERSST